MGPRSIVLAAAALALLVVAAPGAGLDRSDGHVRNLHVRKFLVGRPNFYGGRFVGRSGLGEQRVLPDEVLLFVLSAPVDDASLDSRSVRIGIPTADGLVIPAEGALYRYAEYGYDPVSATYVPKRRYRNRFLFDPNGRRDSLTPPRYPFGFRENTRYAVVLPGADEGSFTTVREADGARLRRTFRTTFTTTVSPYRDTVPPSSIFFEGTDAVGYPLEGRLEVDPAAALRAYFDEPMWPASAVAGATFRVVDLADGSLAPGTLSTESGDQVLSFRFDPGYEAGGREFEITLTTGLKDYWWNPLRQEARARFSTRSAP